MAKPAGYGAPGVGLGLYLAQHIVAQLDGQMTVESKQGVGTTFDVILPLWVEMSRPKRARRRPMSKRLLVVDDEPNLLRAVAACLKAEELRSEHSAQRA